MKIELRTNNHKRPHVDRFGQQATRIQHVVEVIIDGVTFTHDCDTAQAARTLVLHMSTALGIK